MTTDIPKPMHTLLAQLGPDALATLREVLEHPRPVSAEVLAELDAYHVEFGLLLRELSNHRLTYLHATYPKENAETETLWRYYADEGKTVEAIKVLRPKYGYSIGEAKRIVEAYREGRYAFCPRTCTLPSGG